jgi:predicted dehydrogenase
MPASRFRPPKPASLALKGLLRDGSLGRIKIIHSGFSFVLPRKKNGESWRLYSRGAGGGPLADVGVYCINTTRWLMGAEPLEASAYSWNTNAKRFGRAEENTGFQLKFPDGLLLQASASFGAAKASFLKVLGEKGWATLDPAFAYDEERRFFGKIAGNWFEKRFPIIDEFALELDAFAPSIRQGRDPEPNGREGLRDVLVMQAIHQAAREGGWTKIDFSKESG